jgi:uncharacterized membrane protein YbhN (UPF0104 family)
VYLSPAFSAEALGRSGGGREWMICRYPGILKMDWPRMKIFLAKSAITGGLLWLLAGRVDLRRTFEIFGDANRPALAGSVAILLGLMVPATIRWHYVLRALRLRFPARRLFEWNLASGFINQVLPSSLGGDLLRADWCRRAGLPVRAALESVVIDRLMAFSCLVIVVLLASPIFLSSVRVTAVELRYLLIAVVPVAAVSTGALAACYYAPNNVIVSNVRGVLDQCFRVVFRSGVGGRVLGYGLFVHFLRVSGLWLIAIALGIDAGFFLCLAIAPICLLIAMVPISIGGWGVREGAFVGIFSRSGMSTEEALALSVAYGLALIAASLPGAVAIPFLRASNES